MYAKADPLLEYPMESESAPLVWVRSSEGLSQLDVGDLSSVGVLRSAPRELSPSRSVGSDRYRRPGFHSSSPSR